MIAEFSDTKRKITQIISVRKGHFHLFTYISSFMEHLFFGDVISDFFLSRPFTIATSNINVRQNKPDEIFLYRRIHKTIIYINVVYTNKNNVCVDDYFIVSYQSICQYVLLILAIITLAQSSALHTQLLNLNEILKKKINKKKTNQSSKCVCVYLCNVFKFSLIQRKTRLLFYWADNIRDINWNVISLQVHSIVLIFIKTFSEL